MNEVFSLWPHGQAIGAVGVDQLPTPFPSLSEAVVLGVVALACYLALIGAAQVLRRSRNLQFGRFFHLFAASTALYFGLLAAQWVPAWRHDLVRDVGALMMLSATIPLVIVLNRVLWTRVTSEGRRIDAPRLLADTTGIVVFLIAAVLVVRGFYGKTIPSSLLAGSGLVALVVGLAMQDLLSNIVGGFALYITKPFKVGDWLLVDQNHARVLEVTWRSTRLVTDDDVLLEMPNSMLVKQPIINFHQPDLHHAMRTTIGLHYNVPPARAQAVLCKAIVTVPGVCVDPPPHVYVKEFADSAVVYEVKFWIEDHAFKSRIQSDVRSRCWYAARREGMEIPFPIVTIHRPTPRDAAAEARTAAAAALRGHEIFSFLSAAQVDDLVQHSPVVLFAPAESIVEQNAAGGTMFLLVRGSVEVRVAREGTTKVVTQLGPGACLGEMSMLTGEKRIATVVALEEVEAVEITHDAFSTFIHHSPEVLNRLGDLLAQRQLANEQQAAIPISAARRSETRAGFVLRIRGFFELGD